MADPAPGSAPALSSALAALWERFRGTMDERVDAVERASAALRQGGLDAETRRHAEREAHKLAGAVGTFGFAEGSRLAREAEDLLEGDQPLGGEQAGRLAELVAALRAELARPVGAPASSAPVHPGPAAPLVLLVDADSALAARLEAEARQRGLRAVRATTLAEARAQIAAARPDVALLDLALEDEGGLQLLDLLADLDPPVPAVVLTERHGFQDRVEVARRGGRAFLIKPAAPEAVLDAVAGALRQPELQSTVLAVDDDRSVLGSITAHLAPRGVRVEALADPHRFWEVLDAISPDVVVLDVDMPGVNGLELCRVLRNDPRWRSVPVLFLTARSDPDTVAGVFAAGADDYVSKPILGPELVHRIANRLERVRLMRHLADTDALTGVANRRRATEQLDQLLRIAARQARAVSVALIDLDHFKRVNDERGHAAGDEVLRRVARVLCGHFRVEDVVARWGGEEFVVGLFGMEKHDGVKRLDLLRERLRAERFGGPEAEFSVTVSAGIAQYPADGRSVDALLQAADTALYRAKHAGRDQALPAGGASPAADRLDVLVVEGDPEAGRTLVETLEARGIRARGAASAGEALEAVTAADPERRPRLVLLDLALPALDAAALLDRLDRARVLERTRVIVLGAHPDDAELARLLDAGAFDHLARPLSVPLLLHRVRRALRD